MKMVVHNAMYVPEHCVPFSLSCCECDAGDGIESRDEAEWAGWADIQYDDGPSWNFLGLCPQCAIEQPGEWFEKPQPKEGELFT